MHDVRITVMIFTTLVNTKTHTHREIASDRLYFSQPAPLPKSLHFFWKKWALMYYS